MKRKSKKPNLQQILQQLVRKVGMRPVLNTMADICDKHAKAGTPLIWNRAWVAPSIHGNSIHSVATNLRSYMY